MCVYIYIYINKYIRVNWSPAVRHVFSTAMSQDSTLQSLCEVDGLASWRFLQGWRRLIGCLESQVIFIKRSTNLGLFCGKWTVKIRHPMILLHTVPEALVVRHVSPAGISEKSALQPLYIVKLTVKNFHRWVFTYRGSRRATCFPRNFSKASFIVFT